MVPVIRPPLLSTRERHLSVVVHFLSVYLSKGFTNMTGPTFIVGFKDN